MIYWVVLLGLTCVIAQDIYELEDRSGTIEDEAPLTWNSFLNAKKIFPEEHQLSAVFGNEEKSSLKSQEILKELDYQLNKADVFKKVYENYLVNILKLKDTSSLRNAERQEIFKEKLKTIARHNLDFLAGKVTWHKGVTSFTHLTKEEFDRDYRRAPINHKVGGGSCPLKEDDPNVTPMSTGPVDYRNWSIVTSVKNQGACGDCYAFATCAAIEGAYANTNGVLLDLSPQDIRDCMDGAYCSGDGKTPNTVLDYVQKAKGLPLLCDYPHIQDKATHTCKSRNCKRWPGFGKFEYNCKWNTNEDAVIDAINKFGPVAIDIDSSKWDQDYSGSPSPFSSECKYDKDNYPITDHAVAIVGYTDDYYIVKNQWDTNWGLKGYIYITRGEKACCVGTGVYYITKMNKDRYKPKCGRKCKEPRSS